MRMQGHRHKHRVVDWRAYVRSCLGSPFIFSDRVPKYDFRRTIDRHCRCTRKKQQIRKSPGPESNGSFPDQDSAKDPGRRIVVCLTSSHGGQPKIKYTPDDKSISRITEIGIYLQRDLVSTRLLLTISIFASDSAMFFVDLHWDIL